MKRVSLPPFKYRIQVLLAAGITGCVLLCMFLFMEPDFVKDVIYPGSFGPFFILVWFTGFLGWWGISGRWKRSLLWNSIGVTAIGLRLYQLDTWFNWLLLICFGVVWEYYWKISKPTQTNSIN